MQLRSAFAVSLLLLAVPLKSHAASHAGSTGSAPSSAAIVELFTSEGCSSCPPADELLRQINLKQTNAGQLIVGISEHVTYWNNLGWKDPYSLPVFTDRQSVYASNLSTEGPYTADRSNVLCGENGGRKLQHVSVARSIARVATVTDDGEHSVHISFPEGFPTSGTGHHLILFAQEQRQGAILGATTMPL